MPNNPEIEIRHDNPFKDYQNKFVHTQADPLIINWKGKIGYGDIISPISYALNLAEKNSTDVILRFHWPYDSPKKYKPEDKETIQEWIDITWNYMTKPVFYDCLLYTSDAADE